MSNVTIIADKAGSKPASATKKTSLGIFSIVAFGICLPLAAILFELTTRYCARTFFDPFPTNFHVMLFALIPLSNLLIVVAMQRDLKDHHAFLCLLNGMASGIALTYTLMYLPLLPASLALVFAMGMGMLGLAPLLGFFTSWKSGNLICELAKKEDPYFDPDHNKHLGHLLIIASIVAIELPSTLTRMHLHMAAEPATAADGIQWLRQNGSEEVMLRACYERSGKATDIIGSLYESGHQLPVSTARELFYKVTGKPFNSVAIPTSARATMQHAQVANNGASVTDEFDVDADVAGEKVSGVARGLSSLSQLSGRPDPTTATAVLDWSITLKNESDITREARAKIMLPHGAGVNNIHLNIDGKRLSSHLKLRQEARTQYQHSASTGRDPLLVSYCGPDEILAQCTPIHSHSEAKIEISMVVPLTIERASPSKAGDENLGVLTLPFIEEHNFSITTPSEVRLHSAAPLQATNQDPSVVSYSRQGADYVVDAHLKNRVSGIASDNLQFKIPVALHDPAHPRLVTVAGQTVSVTESIAVNKNRQPSKVIVIVDGSGSMAKSKEEIIRAMQSLPSSIKTQAMTVTDLTSQDDKPGADFDKPISAAIEDLRKVAFVGGQTDTSILKSACDRTAEYEDRAVLWIHNSQPVELQEEEKVKILSREAKSPFLYDYQIEPGPNELFNGVMDATTIVRIPNSGNVYDDLTEQFSKWSDSARDLRLTLNATATSESATDCTDAVATLWAREQIGQNADSDQSVDLAQKFNLLTPISSAIVHDPSPLDYSLLVATPSATKASVNPIKAVRRAIRGALNDAFAKVVNQLNSTSSASRGVQFQERVTEFKPIVSPVSNLAASPAASPASIPASIPAADKKEAQDALGAPIAGAKQKDSRADLNANQNEFATATTAADAAVAPEPETWLLTCIVAFAMMAAAMLNRRQQKRKV